MPSRKITSRGTERDREIERDTQRGRERQRQRQRDKEKERLTEKERDGEMGMVIYQYTIKQIDLKQHIKKQPSPTNCFVIF